MNKADLVTAIAEKGNITKKDTEKALVAFTEVIGEELKNGGKIQIVGFGTFEASDRAARIGRNPQDGTTIQIPASRVPKFKPGKLLKSIVNGDE